MPSPAYVIIRRGDNLWRIARRNYGRGIRYEAIFAANRDRIRNPHRIYPGPGLRDADARPQLGNGDQLSASAIGRSVAFIGNRR